MNAIKELRKRKKERLILRVIGFTLIPVGFAVQLVCFAQESPFGIFGMFAGVAGIVMVLRSFLHGKFKGLNQRLVECEKIPQVTILPLEKPTPQSGHKTSLEPVTLDGTDIHINTRDFYAWKAINPTVVQYEFRGTIALQQRNPVLHLYEDKVQTRQYCLQNKEDENFTGKYFQISVRLGILGIPPLPVAQIDGFVSDSPADTNMTHGCIGYRMEGHFLACGGEPGKRAYASTRGQDLVAKALKYPGYTTPANVRLLGICQDCGKSFVFHGYAFYMAQSDVAYSDDGQDCCQICAYSIDKDTWTYEEDGKIFRYYNSFCCPHCSAPYIDYKQHPERKVFGVSGCVHLGKTHYTAQ